MMTVSFGLAFLGPQDPPDDNLLSQLTNGTYAGSRGETLMREVAVHFSLFGVAAILVVLSANFYSRRIELRSPTPATVAPAGIALSAIASLLEGPSVMWNKGMLDEESLCTQVGCSFEDQVQDLSGEHSRGGCRREPDQERMRGHDTPGPCWNHACVCVWGWAQAELQSDHGRITDGSWTDHSRNTRFHKLKFNFFLL
jgi:hypothetical protein